MSAEPATPKTNAALFVSALIGGGGGFCAIIAFLTIYLGMPARVDRLEAYDKAHDAQITELRNDAAQRRELLAAAIATMTEINDRTKRIESVLIQGRR
jgi:type II secretory pathway component PulM